MEGRMGGKNCVDNKKLEYIDQIINDVVCGGYAEVKALAQNRY